MEVRQRLGACHEVRVGLSVEFLIVVVAAVVLIVVIVIEVVEVLIIFFLFGRSTIDTDFDTHGGESNINHTAILFHDTALIEFFRFPTTFNGEILNSLGNLQTIFKSQIQSHLHSS